MSNKLFNSSDLRLVCSRKIMRAYRLYKHTYNYYIGKRIKGFECPPKTMEEIGHFDKEKLIHVKSEYKYKFSDKNLYSGGNFELYKPDKISLCIYEGEIYIRKKFYGSRRHNDFYNELIFYSILNKYGIIPKIEYVDYIKYESYIQYLDGINLAIGRKNILKYTNKNKKYIRREFYRIFDIIHGENVIFNDLGGRDLIMKDGKCYIFDFSDAVYFTDFFLRFKWFKKLYLSMVKEERDKIEATLNNLGV